MADMMSISDAAKRVGISRPRLSKLIDDANVKKTRDGKNMLVDLSEVQIMIQSLASTKKIRTPPSIRPQDAQSGILEHYKEEIRRITLEREELREKVAALAAVQQEIKLLKGAEEQHRKTIDDKNAEVESLKKAEEQHLQTIDNLTIQLEIAATAKPEKSLGILKKANQIYEVIRGK